MSKSISLRKLTLKSSLRFGKYGDFTIQQIIDLKLIIGIRYLRWVYFCCSKLTFVDEILFDVLEIEKQDLIIKPGKMISEHLELKYYPPRIKGEKNILEKGSDYRRSKVLSNKSFLRSKNQK